MKYPIFLSYASADAERVRPLVSFLETIAPVWWDDRIQDGALWDESIAKEIAQAECVVVAWTRTSIESYWVKEEAREGMKRGILVPVLLDDCSPPFGFRGVQATGLQDWAGAPDHRALAGLRAAVVSRLTAVPEDLPPTPEDRPDPPPTPQSGELDSPRPFPARGPKPPPAPPSRERDRLPSPVPQHRYQWSKDRRVIAGSGFAAVLAAGALWAVLQGRGGDKDPTHPPSDSTGGQQMATLDTGTTPDSGTITRVPATTPADTLGAPVGNDGDTPSSQPPANGPAPNPTTTAPTPTGPEGRVVEMLVLSETQTTNLRALMSFLADDPLKRGYHYLVDVDGQMVSLYNEGSAARHTTGANQNTLGIGLMHVTGRAPESPGQTCAAYSEPQMDGLVRLLATLAWEYRLSTTAIRSKEEFDRRRVRDITRCLTTIRIRVGQELANRRVNGT